MVILESTKHISKSQLNCKMYSPPVSFAMSSLKRTLGVAWSSLSQGTREDESFCVIKHDSFGVGLCMILLAF